MYTGWHNRLFSNSWFRAYVTAITALNREFGNNLMCHPVVQQAGKRPFDKQFGWQAYKLSIEMTETSKDVKLSLHVPLAKNNCCCPAQGRGRSVGFDITFTTRMDYVQTEEREEKQEEEEAVVVESTIQKPECRRRSRPPHALIISSVGKFFNYTWSLFTCYRLENRILNQLHPRCINLIIWNLLPCYPPTEIWHFCRAANI